MRLLIEDLFLNSLIITDTEWVCYYLMGERESIFVNQQKFNRAWYCCIGSVQTLSAWHVHNGAQYAVQNGIKCPVSAHYANSSPLQPETLQTALRQPWRPSPLPEEGWRLAEGTSACCVAQWDRRPFFSDHPGQLKCMNMWLHHTCHEVESPSCCLV